MRRPILLTLIALLASLTVLGPPAPAGANPIPGADSAWYTYQGRYSFTVDYRRHLEYGGPDHGTETLHANVDGLLLGVGISRRGIRPNTDGTVLVDGSSTFEEVTDDGNFAVLCDSEKVTDPTGLIPRLASRASGTITATLYGYYGLRSAQMCDATDGPTYPADFDLPSFTSSFVIPPESVGDPEITAPITRRVTWAECPGSGDSGTTTCTYAIDGTITLTLKSGPEPYLKPTKAKVKKSGKAGKASVQAGCRTGCTARLTVTPRTGTKVLASAQATLKAGTTKTLTAGLTRAEMSKARRAGGARFVVTYSAPHRVKQAFVKNVKV